jgi:uncharacterized membrane protein HdeD (DUF308 family)
MSTSEPNPRETQVSNALTVFECPTGRWWLCALLGVVLILMALFVFWQVVAASIVSAIFFGAAIAVGGAFQLVHAFSSRGWRGFIWSFIVGLLFLVGGLLLMINPLAASFGLTLGFAALLIAAGVVRLILAFRHWQDYGWVLLASGMVGILTGIVILAGFPWSGLIVPGLLFGIDLLFHGLWWLAVGLWVRRPPAIRPSALAT